MGRGLTRGALIALLVRACCASVHAQTVTGTSLDIVSPDGTQWLKWDPVNGFDVKTDRGRLIWSGNELKIGALGNDGVKVRWFGLPGVRMCESFNIAADPVNVPLNQIEIAMRCGNMAYASDGTANSGGELSEWVKMVGPNGDSAMRLVRVVSTYGSSDGLPRSWDWQPGYTPMMGVFAQAPPSSSPPPAAGAVYPSSVISQTNLSGSVAAVQALGDGAWMAAQSGGQDTDLVVSMTLDGQTTLDVEVRPTTTAAPLPYLYVYINGQTFISARQLGTSTQTVSVTIPAMTATVQVRVHGSAQTGTVEVGGIAAR